MGTKTLQEVKDKKQELELFEVNEKDAKIIIDFTNEENNELVFYKKTYNGNIVEKAIIKKDDTYIHYYTQDGDVRKFPKDELNTFLIELYNNITKNKVSSVGKEKTTKLGVDLKNRTSLPYFNLRMYGSNTPLFLLFFRNMGLIPALKYLGIRFNRSKTKADNAFLSVKIKHKDGSIGYLNMYAKNIYEQYMLNGLKKDANKIFPIKEEDLESKEVLKKFFVDYYGLKKYLNFSESEYTFIDVTTQKILKSYNYPTEFYEVFGKFMPKKLLNSQVEDIGDLRNQRIRMSESITHLAYQNIQRAIIHMKNNKNQYNIRLDIDPNFITKNLLGSGMLQYTQTINPLEELTLSTKITKSGVGNPKKDQITLQRRDLNPSYFGVVSPSTTNEYGNIGLNQSLSNKTTIKDRFGSIHTKEFKDDINGFDILSAGESVTPFYERDDTTRRIMGQQQQSQFVQIDRPDEPLIQTGYEAILPYLVSDRFAIKAKKDGKVIAINDQIILKYDDGSDDQYLIKNQKARTKRGVFIPLDYYLWVKPGQKVKKGQILATTSSLKSGKLSIGKNLVVALAGYRGYNFEDGWVASESITEKYTNKIYLKLIIPIDSASKILQYKIKKDMETKPGDVLIEFTNTKNDKIEEIIESAIDDEDNENDFSLGREVQGNIIKYMSPGGVIKDVKILINSEHIDKSLLQVYKKEANIIKSKLKKCESIKDPIKKLDCKNNINNADSLAIGGHKLNNNEFDGSIIEIFIEKDAPIGNGSKFTLLGNSGGKGTIQYLIPKGKEPIAQDTKLKIEFMPVPLSIFGRKNISIVLSMYMGKVVYYTNVRVKELIESGRIKEAENLLLSVYSPMDKTKDQLILKSIKDFFTSNSKEQLIKFVKQSDPLQKPAFPMIMPPFANKMEMQDIEKAANILKIPLNEKLIIPEEDNAVTEVAVPVGIIPVIYLEHFVHAMGSARGSINVKKQVTTGQGRSGTKQGAGSVKAGMYDLFSLASLNCANVVSEFHVFRSDNPKGNSKLRNYILKYGKMPSQEELMGDNPEELMEEAKTKKLVKTYFRGAMLEPHF